MENETNKPCTCPDCDDCGCVGYAYVPVQTLCKTFSPDQALMCATLFPELSLTIDEYGKVCKAGGGIE